MGYSSEHLRAAIKIQAFVKARLSRNRFIKLVRTVAIIAKNYNKVKENRVVKNEAKKNMRSVKLISKVKWAVDNQSKDLKRDWMKKFLNLNENDIKLLRRDRKKRGLNKIFEESREDAVSTEKD